MIKIKLNTYQKLVLKALILILFLGNNVLAQQQPQNNKVDKLIKELTETNYSPTTEKLENTLIKIGSPAVPALIKALENKEDRNSVIKVLGKIGPGAKMALPKLLELLDDKDPFIHFYIADAISAISKADEQVKVVVPLLIDKLNDANQDEYRRVSIIKVLGNIGPKAIDATDLLVRELNPLSNYQGQVSKAQEVAIHALAKINPKVAIPLLIIVFNQKDENLKNY
ncbi:MAG: HEAT repeat domain-containing protein [Acidobacteria bacterium]|nr:HEAT repeat domain-containing protein [Acidobacteriota bacterium]